MPGGEDSCEMRAQGMCDGRDACASMCRMCKHGTPRSARHDERRQLHAARRVAPGPCARLPKWISASPQRSSCPLPPWCSPGACGAARVDRAGGRGAGAVRRDAGDAPGGSAHRPAAEDREKDGLRLRGVLRLDVQPTPRPPPPPTPHPNPRGSTFLKRLYIRWPCRDRLPGSVPPPLRLRATHATLFHRTTRFALR